MDSESRFSKTEAGSQVLAHPEAGLPLRCRQLLVMINPQASIGDICRRLGSSFESSRGCLETLLERGYISPAGEFSRQSLSFSREGVKALVSAPKSNLEPSRQYLSKMAESLIGDREHPLYRSIEAASTRDEMLACAESCRKIILMLSDKKAAADFMNKLTTLLP